MSPEQARGEAVDSQSRHLVVRRRGIRAADRRLAVCAKDDGGHAGQRALSAAPDYSLLPPEHAAERPIT